MVSIVLVTYNRAKRLRLSIDDILNQSFKDFELIICDDCSTDSTEELCLEYAAKDSRIRYFRQARNRQMPANCNFGIQQAKFDYVGILHDGDRFRSDLIEQWYNAITSNPNVGLVFNSIGVTDAHDNIITSYHDFEEGIIDNSHLLKNVYFRRWRFDSPVYGEVMVKKKLLEQHGFFKKEYGFYADVDFWMQLLHSHDAYYCADTLITGPSKRIQPRLFEDNAIRTFLYMFNIQLKHRKKAFRNKPLRLVGEMVVFWGQVFLNLSYGLLLIVKNLSFRAFLDAARLLKQSVLFLIPWTVILLLYPLLFPFLKAFDYVKTMVPKSLAPAR